MSVCFVQPYDLGLWIRGKSGDRDERHVHDVSNRKDSKNAAAALIRYPRGTAGSLQDLGLLSA